MDIVEKFDLFGNVTMSHTHTKSAFGGKSKGNAVPITFEDFHIYK